MAKLWWRKLANHMRSATSANTGRSLIWILISLKWGPMSKRPKRRAEIIQKRGSNFNLLISRRPHWASRQCFIWVCFSKIFPFNTDSRNMIEGDNATPKPPSLSSKSSKSPKRKHRTTERITKLLLLGIPPSAPACDHQFHWNGGLQLTKFLFRALFELICLPSLA